MGGPRRDAAALAVGSTVSGLLAYVLFALSTQTLGAESTAPLSVLWTYWSFAAAALTFPLQHWIVQSVAAHDGEGVVHATLPRVAAVVALAAALVGALSWLARDELFHRRDVWFPVLVAAATLGAGFIGVVRGGLSSRRRFVAVAWSLVAENALRCLGVIVLVVSGVRASVAYGLSMAVGSLVGLGVPSSFRFTRDQGQPATESPLRFLSGAAGGQLIGQAVLTAGPVVLALSGGTAREVTSLFAGLALFRAPYTLAIGLVSQLTGKLTSLVVRGRYEELRRVRTFMLVGTAASVVLAALLGAAAGPLVLRLVFGADVRLTAFTSMLVAIGSTLALASLVLTIVIIAQSRSAVLARAWVVGALAGIVVFVSGPGTPLEQTCWAFVAAEATAFVVLVVEDLRGFAALQAAGPAGRVRNRSAQ